jgi:AraC-like DNA-binding protein
MPTPSPLLSLAVLFDGGFALVLALSVLFKKERRTSDYLAILFLFSVAVWVILGGLVALGADISFNAWALTIPAFFTSVPLLYLYFRSLIDPSRHVKSRDAMHAILPAMSLIVAIPYLGAPVDIRAAMRLSTPRKGLATVFLPLMLYAAAGLSVGYFLRLLSESVKMLRGAPSSARPVLVSSVCLTSLLSLYGIIYFLNFALSLRLQASLFIIDSIFLSAIYILGARYPEYRQVFDEEGARVRYARSRITLLDMEDIRARIESLMRDDLAYHDPEFSLELLAARLEIDSHQLSEFLNARLGQSFLELVNSYRVAEAERLLAAEKGRKVLDIAFEVGFNSSSAFYESFKRVTGTTPSGYRRAN